MTDKIAILGLVIALLSGVAVPVGLAMLDRGATSGAAPPASGDGAAPESSGAVPSTAPPASAPTDGTSAGGSAGPSPTFDGKTLELAEDSYADLDSGKVDDDELFRREADIGLRSLDLTAARAWDYDSTVRMAVLADGDGGPQACAGATRYTRSLSDQKMRVGAQLCVRSAEGSMFLLRIGSIPTYKSSPPAITLQLTEVPYDPAAAMFGTTLDLAEDYYVDLDGRKVGDDEPLRREADIALRSLDLTAAGVWDYDSTVNMTIADGVTSPAACGQATKKATRVSDQDMRVGTKVCVRSTGGRMFLLRVEQIPTYTTQPPVLVLRIA
jgi:hypothetical protein